MSQPSLFPDPQALCTKVIARRRDFEALFAGFTDLKAVSYVISPELLLEFFEKGYTHVEVVVGENLSDRYRQDLAQKGIETVQKLAERMALGQLKVYVPDRTLHTKLYLLEKPGRRRVIVTSANLTETARRAQRQINYAWYADLESGHPWVAKLEEDYQAHARYCSLFMGDLAELMRQSGEERKKEIIKAWLKAAAPEEVQEEARKLIQEISRRSVEMASAGAEPVFELKLPDAPAPRRQVERFLAPLGSVDGTDRLRLSGSGYLRYIQESHGVPLMIVDRARQELRLGLDGAVRVLSAPLPEPPEAAQALEHLEAYFNTVDMGQAPDARFAKMSLYEALLYFFSAPFANEQMVLKRSRYAAIDSRGPRFLYIYGPSQNGKSTFLRFALKLITGRVIEPLNGGEFAKRKIRGAASVGTVFPLVFDDLVLAPRYGLFEEVLKSHWEAWWSPELVSPQIILSSNTYSLRDWAKSRVKRLDFDVQFTPGGQGKETLARLFAQDNRIFEWFSKLYFQELSKPGPLPEDELEPARRVFETIYAHAGRPLPDYFPREPIESLYDPGRRDWREITLRLRKARIEWDHDRASVHFADDMQPYEIKAYENALPPSVKQRRRGKTLVIETPKEFKAWLDGGGSPAPWWRRILGR